MAQPIRAQDIHDVHAPEHPERPLNPVLRARTDRVWVQAAIRAMREEQRGRAAESAHASASGSTESAAPTDATALDQAVVAAMAGLYNGSGGDAQSGLPDAAAGAVLGALAAPNEIEPASAAPAEAPVQTPAQASAQPAAEVPADAPAPPFTAGTPGATDAWLQERQTAMADVAGEYQAAKDAEVARFTAAQSTYRVVDGYDESGAAFTRIDHERLAAEFPMYTRSSDESGAVHYRLNEQAFREAWLARPSEALTRLAQHYGLQDQQALTDGYRDVIDLALRGNVGLREGRAAAGMAMADPAELAALDQYLGSDMNQAMILLFGQGPVEPARSPLALEQVRRYGADRYEQMQRLEQALAHVQKDYADALAAARNDPTQAGPGWYTTQVGREVGGVAGESGWLIAPTIELVDVQRFSVEAFSTWYVQQGIPSNQAFAVLYGVGREVEISPEGFDESGALIPARTQIVFEVGMGEGKTGQLVLDGDSIRDPEMVKVDLNAPPKLHQMEGVHWNPLLGWVTHQSNIKRSRDWFETVVKLVIVAVVSYVTFGVATGGAVASFWGAVAGGAAAGAAGAATSGVLNGNFDWGDVLKGAALGGIGGGLSYGAGQLAQDAGNMAFENAVEAAGGAIGPNGVVVGLDANQVNAAIEAGRGAQSAINFIGRTAQSGVMAELGGGDFGDGLIGGFISQAGQLVGQGTAAALTNADGFNLDARSAGLIGGTVGVGTSALLTEARGGDGAMFAVNGIIDLGVNQMPLSNEPTGPLLDDDGNVLPGALGSNLSEAQQREQLETQLRARGYSPAEAAAMAAGAVLPGAYAPPGAPTTGSGADPRTPASYSGPVFDDDGNLMPGVIDPTLPVEEQHRLLAEALQRFGLPEDQAWELADGALPSQQGSARLPSADGSSESGPVEGLPETTEGETERLEELRAELDDLVNGPPEQYADASGGGAVGLRARLQSAIRALEDEIGHRLSPEERVRTAEMLLGFVPVVGEALSVYEFIFGKSALTGDEVSRAMAIAGLIGGPAGDAVRAARTSIRSGLGRELVQLQHAAAAENRTLVHASSGRSGNWPADLRKPQPNAMYVLDNGHVYRTDAQGRVVSVEGTLSLDRLDRSASAQTRAGRVGGDGYDGGHLIGHQVGGTGDGINLVAQMSSVNRGEYRVMENGWAQAIRDGKTVEVKITPVWDGPGSTVPSRIVVESKINGVPQDINIFRN